jgi:hypothetical protein
LANDLLGGEPFICSLTLLADADMSDVMMTVVVSGLLLDTNNPLSLHLSSCHAKIHVLRVRIQYCELCSQCQTGDIFLLRTEFAATMMKMK